MRLIDADKVKAYIVASPERALSLYEFIDIVPNGI